MKNLNLLYNANLQKPFSHQNSLFDEQYYENLPSLIKKDSVDFQNIYYLYEQEPEHSFIISNLIKIKKLKYFYHINNMNEVENFLNKEFFLIAHLFLISEKIKYIFEKKFDNLLLEPNNDPEEDYQGLSVYIETKLSPEDALKKLDEFDANYFLSLDYEIRTLLTVMVKCL